MTSGNNIIAVIPLGDVFHIIPNIVAANIQAVYSLPVEILGPMKLPEYAFDKKRMQYDAGCILDLLDKTDTETADKIIAVCTVDLFIPIFTHVFGEAQLGGKSAVVSIYRLQQSPESLSESLIFEHLIYERMAKVALHETGHLFNMHHCHDEKCLMHFSGNLDDLDKTPMLICRYCLAVFRDAIKS
ncbi:zinc metallopeptidase [Desulfobacterales bacterium HSG17]|nr:zinc metallopeptidase [Desulfobacterales bacterium HSG17]